MNKLILKCGRYIKRQYYIHKYHLFNVDKTVYFGGASTIFHNLIAGKHVYIGPQVHNIP